MSLKKKLAAGQWSAEWLLFALLLASVLGYFCWTVLPAFIQSLFTNLLVSAVLPLIVLALLVNGFQAMAKEQKEFQRNWQHFAEQANLTFQLSPWRSPWRFLAGQRFCEWAMSGVYQQRALTVEQLKIYVGRQQLDAIQGTVSLQNPAGIHFRIQRRGISSIVTSLLPATQATVEQRELEIRFHFSGQPVSYVSQIAQNPQLQKLLLDPWWLLGPSVLGPLIDVEAEKLTFCVSPCYTADELQRLLEKIYALTALIEQEGTLVGSVAS